MRGDHGGAVVVLGEFIGAWIYCGGLEEEREGKGREDFCRLRSITSLARWIYALCRLVFLDLGGGRII